GELRRQLATELGRLFDGEVVGVELFSTCTQGAPDLSLTLQELTYPHYCNVCLDVTGRSDRPNRPSHNIIGEHLLQKHMRNGKFQAGIAQHLWRLIQLEWPYVLFGIRRSIRMGGCEVGLRLNLERYPLAPPLVQLWDLETRKEIEPQRWPEAFIRFITINYPEFVDICADSYCPQLLH